MLLGAFFIFTNLTIHDITKCMIKSMASAYWFTDRNSGGLFRVL